jgi:transketolase
MSSEAAKIEQPQTVTHSDMANAIRALAMDAVQQANSGHPGMPMGMADVATVLYTQFLKFDPKNPTWQDRDRFILSAGHGSMLLYALNFLTGYEKITLDDIKHFRQLHRVTAGHPEYNLEAGIETTTGPLGQGLANGVGMALAEEILAARFGRELVEHYTYVIAGDGCLMEGISHEACSFAGHLGLGRLIVLYDDNQISIDGPTYLSFSENIPERFESYGWHVLSIDGHDPDAISRAIAEAQIHKDQPSIICCRTKIGYGAPNKEGSSSCHGSPLGEEEIAGARESLGWPHAPFEIPDAVLDAWRGVGRSGQEERKSWQLRLDTLEGEDRELFDRFHSGKVSHLITETLETFKKKISEEKPKLATRQASGNVLDVIIPRIFSLIGGSADLTGSNNTFVKDHMPIVSKDNFDGRYIHYGVREHGMAAIMNGMALHKGLIPYSGTFLCFADYCRPSIRLSALMKQRVVYVMTHDSIGLGEDGPTHQPVEHLASLRAMPNLLVMRPADAVEAAECWQIALEEMETPSVLSLTRQGLPTVRTQHSKENLTRKGAYVLAEAGSALKVTIFATGSEVHLALEAREKLESEGTGTRVVSVPCFELFFAQDEKYRDELIGNDSVKIAIEAACKQGWEAFIGTKGSFVGMKSFGDSAPAEELYKYFGITSEAVVKAAHKAL